MKLAKQCDVVLENMSEGATARLGVNYKSVRRSNPKIIYASIKALGEPSAYPGLKGMDIVVQALSGIMEVTGFPDGPPTRCGLPIADLVAPLYAVNGILSALIYRGRTGEGQLVRVSMLDCLASWVAKRFSSVRQGRLCDAHGELSGPPGSVRRVSEQGRPRVHRGGSFGLDARLARCSGPASVDGRPAF